MRLLFDENLSYRLVDILKDEYPESTHVSNVGLKGAGDHSIWNFSKDNEFMIVSKDTDFRERSFVEGHPPKVIWLEVGNAGTLEIVKLLKRKRIQVERFVKQQEESLLILSVDKKFV